MVHKRVNKNEETSELRRGIARILLALVAGGVTLLAFVLFLQNNYSEILSENSIYIENTATLTSHRLSDMLENAQSSVATLARLYADMETTSGVNLEFLSDIANSSTFDYVEYVDSSGTNYTTDGQTADVSHREYFTRGMKGKSGIEVVQNTLITHETLIVFYTPVYRGSSVSGVLKGEYKGERIMRILDETYFGEHTVSYLCEADGTVIVQSGSAEPVENISSFGEDARMSERTRREFTDALKNYRSYGYTFKGANGTTNAYLAQVSGVDWCVLQVYPSSVTAQMVSRIRRASMLLVLAVVLVFGIYIALIFLSSKRKQRLLEREKTSMQRIVDGVNRLFARFIVVNLADNSYSYLRDYSKMESSAPREGAYSDFVAYFSGAILETVGDVELTEVLTREWLIKNLGCGKPIPRFEFRIRRAVGERWEELSVICLDEREGKPSKVLFAIQDVTEVKEIELHSREVLTEALRAARDANSAKSDFMSRMSHDIRTPLNAILGMSSIASMHMVDTARVKDCLEKIRASGSHLLSMVNEILDFSKIESGQMSLESAPFSVSGCVKCSRDMFRQQIREKGLVLKIADAELEHDRVVGDERRLQRILVNILANAVKFTQPGGSITLGVREKKTPVSGSACYEFCCEDTGEGMDEEFLKHVFEPFTRAADSRTQKAKGSGLGLPISRSLAKLMDGDITAESTLGEGSRFTVRVILKLDEAPEPKARLSEGDEHVLPRFDGKKVLVVEDNEMNAEISVEFLRLFGIEPEVAHNGREAVDILLSSEYCGYNLVLMDIQMPVMNGYEAARVIRSTHRVDLNNLPIIAITANAFQEDVERSIAAGMNAHISKPVSPAKFEAILKEWL